MEINWAQVKRVQLNDRVLTYRPDRACLDLIGKYLPDGKVLGFGKYGFWNMWFLLVESNLFKPNSDVVESMTMRQIRGMQDIPIAPPPPNNIG